MRKILISGDSWSFAVYNAWHGGFDILEEAFGHQLSKFGYNVNNVSVAGSSNLRSISYLERALEQDSSYDYIFWVQTDPIRDFRTEDSFYDDNYKRMIPVYDIEKLNNLIVSKGNSIKSAAKSILFDSYNRLDQIAKKNSKIIYCMGGCSSLTEDIIKFSNLRSLIKSIPEFLIVNHTDGVMYDTEEWLSTQYVKYVKEHKIRIEDTDWYECTEEFLNKTANWSRCEEFFRPDLWHPNGAGHKLITEYIIKTLGLE